MRLQIAIGRGWRPPTSLARCASERIRRDLLGDNSSLHGRKNRLAVVQCEADINQMIETRRSVERDHTLLPDGRSIDTRPNSTVHAGGTSLNKISLIVTPAYPMPQFLNGLPR